MAAETAKVPAEADCVVQFAAKCPLGNCPKRGKWLGAKGIWYSERRCRQAVYDHLASTGSHAKLTLDDCALEADTVVVERWNVSQDDPEVLADAAKSNATVQEIAEWQDQAVTYEDPEVHKNQKRMIPSEPLEAPPRQRGRHESSGSRPSHSHAIERRRRSRSPPPQGDRSLARVSNRLENQIHDQTRNAYIFVKAGLPK